MDVDIETRRRARHDAGLSHIPEDRHRRGLVLDYSVADNLILGLQHQLHDARASSTASGSGQRRRADRARSTSGRRIPALPARALSGGNQQKVVIAREMGRDFTVLLAAQPTRGVDVGAIEFIHAAAARGARRRQGDPARVRRPGRGARALRPHRGDVPRQVPVVMPAAEATEDVLGAYMTGAKKGNAA